MANKWADLSMYGMRLMLSVTQDRKKIAVIMSDKGAFEPKIAHKLEAKGFEKKSHEGQLVYAIGTLPPNLLAGIFPKMTIGELDTQEKVNALILKGSLEPYVAPVDELDEIDATAFQDIDTDAKKAKAPAQAPAAPKKADEAQKPVAAKKARAPKADTPKAAAPKPATPKVAAEAKPREAQKPQTTGKPLPGWEALNLDRFEEFLIYEGVSPDARADYRSTISAMRTHFSFSDIFETEHPVDPNAPNKGYGSVLRERMKAETNRKDLAKSRIVDCLYGFANEFLNRNKAQRAAQAAFTSEQAANVDKLWDWTEDFMLDFDKKHGGIANFLTTYPRVVRIAGMRTLFDLVTSDEPRALEAKLKADDKRFAQDAMPGKQFANFMNPVISKLRRSDDAIKALREKRIEVFSEPEKVSAPTPSK